MANQIRDRLAFRAPRHQTSVGAQLGLAQRPVELQVQIQPAHFQRVRQQELGVESPGGEQFAERTALIPIPLAAARKRQRGYNQSALIAYGIGRRWRIPVWDDLVTRSRETSSQTRLTPEQRLDNVAGSFCVKSERREQLRGAHVILVDDVVTTAATLNTCARILYEAGTRIISYVTFGRAHASGDRL